MKKPILPLLVLAFAASAVQAQYRDMYSILYHDTTGFFYNITTSMQQRDGDHLIDINLAEEIGNGDAIPLGRMCYKISPTSFPLTITDSLFVADTAIIEPSFLARDPRGDGNIRVTIEYREDCDSTFVRISHFPDDDLHSNPEEDVVVPICEGVAGCGSNAFLIDSWGDLIMTYFRPAVQNANQHIARIGLDGTLKHQALLTENIFYDAGSLRVLKESPIQYYKWYYYINDYPYANLDVFVIDSLFHKETVNLNGILRQELVASYPYYDTMYYIYEHERLTINYNTEVIPAGGNDVLVAAEYTHDTNFSAMTQDRGVAVARYDLFTKQLKGYIVFNDSHWWGSFGIPLGLKMLSDGTVYFLYKEYGFPEESVNIVKMDVNFNVEWKRFCKTGDIVLSSYSLLPPIVYEDAEGEEKGVAWSGYGYKSGHPSRQGWVYFMLNHDGAVSATEGGIEVRPYDFYPNPTRDELHLNYSPDIQPVRIELYDLQGRLVQTQSKNLESLNMAGLPAGTYTMRVMLEGGKVFSDKVVKE